MDDAAPAPAVQQQQQHDSPSASGAQAAAPPTWGTLEELLLVGAITRHGAGDWAIIATELQSRAKLLNMPAAYFSPEACKSRFDALNGKYGLSFRGGVAPAGDGRDKEPENHWPWFEEIRKRRVAQLRRELERHDGSISILTQKLKRLKTERGPKQLPETCKPPPQPAEGTTSSGKAAIEVPPSPAGEAQEPVVLEQSQGGSPVDAPALGDAGGSLQALKDNQVAVDNAGGGDEQQQGPPVEEAGTSQEEATGSKMEVSKSDLSGEAAKDEAQAEAAQATDVEVDDGAERPTAQAVEPTEAGAEAEDEMKVAEGLSEDQARVRPADDAVGKETESSSCTLKMLAEDDRPVVAVSAEASDGQANTRTEANTAGSPEDRSEKEASSNGSSQEASKPVEEKSDESQVAAGKGVENLTAEKAVDAGSPLSAEGPQEQSKDGASQVEKSEVGSQVEGLGEDSSPTSKSLKKGDPKLADWLKTLYNHKFGPMFKQRQESQDDSRYDQLIKRHIDLNMIRSRLEAGGYSSSMEFFRDLLLLFSNATVFYPRESQEHNAAALLRKLTMEEMDRVLRAEDAGPSTKPTTTRKRPITTNKATTMPAGPIPAPVPAPAAALIPATAPAVPTTSRTTTQGGDVSVSENSKSKSASVSLGVRSSKGGDEGEGGEPEVSGKSKPLKAYVRKNRAERGKAVKESPLETIVQKEAAMAAAKDSKTAAAASKGKNAAKEKEKLTKEKSEKSGSRSSKGAAASAAASVPPPAASAAAPAVAPVRGARNKRSKESSQRGGGNAGKRSRRT